MASLEKNLGWGNPIVKFKIINNCMVKIESFQLTEKKCLNPLTRRPILEFLSLLITKHLTVLKCNRVRQKAGKT